MPSSRPALPAIKTCIVLLTSVAVPIWAGGEFLCAGGVSSGFPSVAGPAKVLQAQIAVTGQAILLFAHFNDELPTDAVLPVWAGDIFDPNLPGSFSHFYDTMSFGQHRMGGEVASTWDEAEGTVADYLSAVPAEAGRFTDFALEIIRAADADVDYSQFDNDGPDGKSNSGDDDGYVDAVFIVMQSTPAGFIFGGATGIARLEFEEEFRTNDLGFAGQPLQIDPLKTTIQQGRSFAETVGSICHEYGHVLGLPDLFNTGFLQNDEPLGPEDDSAGIGAWGLMGWGALGWNGDDGPNSFSAWSRWHLGWSQVHQWFLIPSRVESFDETAGYLYSDDRGETWTRVEFSGETGPPVSSLSFAGNGTLYAAALGNITFSRPLSAGAWSEAGVHASPDGGVDWQWRRSLGADRRISSLQHLCIEADQFAPRSCSGTSRRGLYAARTLGKHGGM